MGRMEYKYLVRCEELPRLRHVITPFVEMDSFAAAAPCREYTVRSIYFDTPGLASYYQKDAGIHTRRKLRVRGYGKLRNDSLVVLEIKRKYNMEVRKARAFLRFTALEELIATGAVEQHVQTGASSQRIQAEQDARAFLYHLHRYSMLPVVLVAYEREAFLGRFDPRVRLTFDKVLRGRVYPDLHMLFDEGVLRNAMSEHFILEVKFEAGMPTWAAAIIEDFGLERQALSKFGICLENEGLGGAKSSRFAWAAYQPPRTPDAR